MALGIALANRGVPLGLASVPNLLALLAAFAGRTQRRVARPRPHGIKRITFRRVTRAGAMAQFRRLTEKVLPFVR